MLKILTSGTNSMARTNARIKQNYMLFNIHYPDEKDNTHQEISVIDINFVSTLLMILSFKILLSVVILNIKIIINKIWK